MSNRELLLCYVDWRGKEIQQAMGRAGGREIWAGRKLVMSAVV